jgi:hypothetical protein
MAGDRFTSAEKYSRKIRISLVNGRGSFYFRRKIQQKDENFSCKWLWRIFTSAAKYITKMRISLVNGGGQYLLLQQNGSTKIIIYLLNSWGFV